MLPLRSISIASLKPSASRAAARIVEQDATAFATSNVVMCWMATVDVFSPSSQIRLKPSTQTPPPQFFGEFYCVVEWFDVDAIVAHGVYLL